MKTILEIYTKIFTNRRGGYTGRRRARRIRAVTHRTLTRNFLRDATCECVFTLGIPRLLASLTNEQCVPSLLLT